LVGFVSSIRQRLYTLRMDEKTIGDLTGGNITSRLALTTSISK
jgi:hypothetical protein